MPHPPKHTNTLPRALLLSRFYWDRSTHPERNMLRIPRRERNGLDHRRSARDGTVAAVWDGDGT